jgi:sulfatase maturation enzyme AslB (radical SAM superfamily)
MSTKWLSNPAFCVLPFIEQFYPLSDSQRFCCYSPTSIDHLDSASSNELRKKIKNGEKIVHCQSCYDLEKSHVISPRLLESARWLKDAEVSDYIEKWTEDSPRQVFFYDIRYDNKCNLACITCNPTDSSLWAKELGINSKSRKLELDLEKIKLAKKVYLAGGEPLIIDQFIQLIEYISTLDQQPELVINTNLTRTNSDLKEFLKKIKKLTLTVSVDGVEKINEYHRWPMKWSKFLENLQWANSINCNIQFNTVVDAVSILNLHRLQDIEHLCNQWSLTILTRPQALLVNNLPPEIKQTVHDNFLNIRQSRFYQNDLIFKTKVDNITDIILTPGDPILLSSYIKTLDSRRNIDHRNYLGINLI